MMVIAETFRDDMVLKEDVEKGPYVYIYFELMCRQRDYHSTFCYDNGLVYVTWMP